MILILGLILITGIESMAKEGPIGPTLDPPQNDQAIFSRGLGHYQKGQHAKAILEWKTLLSSSQVPQSEPLFLDTLIHLSHAYQALGRHQSALSILTENIPVAEKTTDDSRKALYYCTLGDLLFSLGKGETASGHFEKALEAAKKAKNPTVLIHVMNNLGNFSASEGDFESAALMYEECLRLKEASTPSLLAGVYINLARLHLLSGNREKALNHIDNAWKTLNKAPDNHQKALSMMTIAGLLKNILRTQPEMSLPAGISLSELFQIALRIGEQQNHPYLVSAALGEMAQLETQKIPEAMALTRRAILYAQQGNYPELLYRWQWQLAKLLTASGDRESAIKGYYEALNTLTPIRNEFFSGFRSHGDRFNEQVKPVYLELAHLLIKEARGLKEKTAHEQKLLEARRVMEMLKTAELQDFFGDECVAAITPKKIDLDRSFPKTAIIYPIPFPDELSILLFLPDGIREYSTPVSYESLKESITRYRKLLQTRVNNRFLTESTRLYTWMAAPFEKELHAYGIDTLIVAPDGILRLVPVSTLYDGSRFLIEKFAISTIPSMSMVEPKPFATPNPQILLSGVSDAVQAFSALPSVPKELEDIQKIMGGKVRLLNRDHTIGNLTSQLQNHSFSIVHLATHGVFGGTPEESFLLTYDDRLTMNRLENLIFLTKFREEPVELLTLSACQTALGDERATLGLAGVAIKAGVRSAVATLWYVDDEATSLAIREFYRQLRAPGNTKARALQNAQKSLIAEDRYWHPLYWAPFLLIGNWM
jgi:CHAT domain-containing protein/Flp pilus assembly protein TadD